MIPTLKPHLQYLAYLLRHKALVLGECARCGLRRRGLVHDLSKFRPSEWGPYVERFHGDGGGGEAFSRAWQHHANRNSHHWQYWVMGSVGKDRVLDMPAQDVREMVADWIAMGRARSTCARQWYESNRGQMVLSPRTQQEVERLLEHMARRCQTDGKNLTPN